MRGRVLAQGFTVIAMAVGVLYKMGDQKAAWEKSQNGTPTEELIDVSKG